MLVLYNAIFGHVTKKLSWGYLHFLPATYVVIWSHRVQWLKIRKMDHFKWSIRWWKKLLQKMSNKRK